MLNRWKQHFRRLTSIMLTTVITFTATASYPAQTFASTGDGGAYVSEVIAYQGSLEDAQAEYPDYTFVEEDISEGGGSGKPTYLGYQTTDDVSLAIRDIATLQMGSNYTITDYDSLMEEKKENIHNMVYGLQVAANEYKENYDAGKQRALDAYELLNKYYEDDTGLKMGDFFLADETEVSKDNYVTLLLESNSTTIEALQKILLTAVDTEDDTWVDRAGESKDFDGLVKKENKRREAAHQQVLSMKAARAYYRELYQDYMDKFNASWNRMRKGLEKYMAVGISINDPEAADYIEENADEENNSEVQEYAVYGSIFETLDKIPSEDGTLADLFLLPFEEVDETQLYVLMDAMSEAQLELAADMGLPQLFIGTGQQAIETEDEDSLFAISEETRVIAEDNMAGVQAGISEEVDAIIEEIEDSEDIGEDIVKEQAISVYAGVDRNFFKGSIGMTNNGKKQQLAGETPWYNNTTVIVTSCIAGAIGIGLFATGLYKLLTGLKAFNGEIQELSTEITTIVSDLKIVNNKILGNEKNLRYIQGFLHDYSRYSSMSQGAIVSEMNKANSKVETIQKVLLPQREELQEELAIAQSKKEAAELGATKLKILGGALIVIGIVLTAASLATNIARLMDDDNPSYDEIPEKMIDIAQNDQNIQPFLYYSVVRDQNDKAADLNAYTSGTWLALYTTRSYDAGLPILAEDFASVRRGDIGSDTLNMGFAHEFGAQDPENLLGYSKNAQDADATFLLFNHGEVSLSGSTFGGNNTMSLVILAGLAIVGGAVLFMYRKKEEEAA